MCCISNLISEILTFPFEFLILLNLFIMKSYEDFSIFGFLFLGSNIFLHLLAADFPNTTRSSNEFEPNLLAP